MRLLLQFWIVIGSLLAVSPLGAVVADSGDTLHTGPAGTTATYAYDGTSTRLKTTSLTAAGQMSPTLSATRDFTPAGLLESRLTTVSNPATVGSPSQATHTHGVSYTFDGVGRRRTAAHTDTRSTTGTFTWTYGYNERGELIHAHKGSPTVALLPGTTTNADYDDIGNRIGLETTLPTDTSNPPNLLSTTWTVDDLNQLTSRENTPHHVLVGATDPLAEVTLVTGAANTSNTPVPTDSQDGSFAAVFPANNSGGPDHLPIHLRATKPGPDGIPRTSDKQTTLSAPASPEAFSYDADGNLLADSLRHYTYDAHDRLTTITPIFPQPGQCRVHNHYDHRHRRVLKVVDTWDPDTAAWQPAATTQFTYDGWRVLTEKTTNHQAAPGSQTTTTHHTWGLDLSGTIGGAGDTGGLLSSTVHKPDGTTQTRLYSYDGNGNITHLHNQHGELLAHYQYGPFGKTTHATGPEAQSNAWRFSTRYADQETGLIYYGYRFYSPELGRWMSRDPIGEAGGANLYANCSGDLVNCVDRLGLDNHKSQEIPLWLGNINLGSVPIGASQNAISSVDTRTGELNGGQNILAVPAELASILALSTVETATETFEDVVNGSIIAATTAAGICVGVGQVGLETVLDTLKLGKDLLTDPVGTVSAIVEGVGNLIKQAQEEGLADILQEFIPEIIALSKSKLPMGYDKGVLIGRALGNVAGLVAAFAGGGLLTGKALVNGLRKLKNRRNKCTAHESAGNSEMPIVQRSGGKPLSWRKPGHRVTARANELTEELGLASGGGTGAIGKGMFIGRELNATELLALSERFGREYSQVIYKNGGVELIAGTADGVVSRESWRTSCRKVNAYSSR